MHPRDDYDTSLRTRRRSMSPPSQSRYHAHAHGGPGHGHGHHGHAGHHHHHHHHAPDRKRLRPSSSIETRLPGDDSGSGPGSGIGPMDDGWDREAYEPSRRMMMSTSSTTKRIGHENSKSRRLYIGNIPFHAGLTDGALTQLFSALYVVGFGGQVPGRALPVVSFWLHADGKFGFMELRGEQETVNMMCFNQTTLHGRVLKVNRPSDFKADIHAPHVNQLSMHRVNAKAVVQLCEQLDGLVVPPPHVVAQARQEELSLQAEKTERAAAGGEEDMGRGQTDGEAKDMEVEMDVDDGDGIQREADANVTRQSPAPDANTSGSKARDRRGRTMSGNDTSVQTNEATKAMDNTEQQQAAAAAAAAAAEQQQQQTQQQTQPKVAGEEEEEEEEDWYEEKSTKTGSVGGAETQTETAGGKGQEEDVVVISLQNLVTDKDLAGSEEDFEDIVEDVREECSNYGGVECVEIPRDGPFKGTAFVQFIDADGANRAIEQLADRVFEGRRIIAVGVKGVTSAKEATERR